jgi:hypothetical protein
MKKISWCRSASWYRPLDTDLTPFIMLVYTNHIGGAGILPKDAAGLVSGMLTRLVPKQEAPLLLTRRVASSSE